MIRPRMARTVTLRPWQKSALERFAATSALTAARQALAAEPGRRLIVVVPTAHLKAQWAGAATAFDLHLDPRWSAGEGALPADMHGVVTTYQQVASSAGVLRGLARGAFVIFDELHHAADALTDGGVVRPVYFPRIDGMMEWSAPDGSVHAHSFEDALDSARASQRLRTAYSLDGEWLPHVLRQAHEQLLAIRKRQPGAGGLVIATDQDHARGIAQILQVRLGVRAVVATSDDPEASNLISRFAAGSEPWIVAVRMVSEGVDIPRLRVGVFATTTTTELFFRQAVGRLVRWTPGTTGQKSFLFIPDEPRLRARAFAIAEQRRHCLRREDPRLVTEGGAELDELESEQASLFAPISAVPLDAGEVPDWELDDRGVPEPAYDAALTIPLPPLPPAGRTAAGRLPEGRTLREHKSWLREANTNKVRAIARQTGLTHAAVNNELNRITGLCKVSEATVEDLERRLARAEKWLEQESSRHVAG